MNLAAKSRDEFFGEASIELSGPSRKNTDLAGAGFQPPAKRDPCSF
jgi:hypothetical protein